MANVNDVRRKAIKVVLSDGIEREIKFTLNTLADLEEKYGSVETAFATLEQGKITSVRYILWAALRNNDESLTEREVGNLIDIASIGEVMSAIEAATSSDMPEQDKVVEATVVTEAKVIDMPVQSPN